MWLGVQHDVRVAGLHAVAWACAQGGRQARTWDAQLNIHQWCPRPGATALYMHAQHTHAMMHAVLSACVAADNTYSDRVSWSLRALDFSLLLWHSYLSGEALYVRHVVMYVQ